MTRPIGKLLFVSDGPHFGGAERYVANLAGAARRRGIGAAVCWIKPSQAPQDVFAPAVERGAELAIVPAERAGHVGSLMHEFREIIRRHAPDAMIVNASGRPRFWTVPWIGRFERTASLWVHHMIDQTDYRRLRPERVGGRMEGLHLWRWPQALRHRLAAAASQAVVALNEQDRTQIARDHGVRRERIQVISNGIDTDQYRFDAHARAEARRAWLDRHGWPSDESFILGTAGRLVHGKGIEMLLQAVAAVQGRGCPVRLVVAGEGPDLGRLKAISERLGLADTVAFLGRIDDMPRFYCGLDAFALCSSTESFGLVLSEAMSCERAVVATPTAGARAQIDNGLTGVLLDSYSTDNLRDALAGLIGQPAHREHLGRNARRCVIDRFSVDACLDRTLDLLTASARRIERPHRIHPVATMEEAA